MRATEAPRPATEVLPCDCRLTGVRSGGLPAPPVQKRLARRTSCRTVPAARQSALPGGRRVHPLGPVGLLCAGRSLASQQPLGHHRAAAGANTKHGVLHGQRHVEDEGELESLMDDRAERPRREQTAATAASQRQPSVEKMRIRCLAPEAAVMDWRPYPELFEAHGSS